MEILYFKTLSSTQIWLSDAIRNNTLQSPICVVAQVQEKGIGSRGNTWDSLEFTQSLTFSFALPLKSLPSDLKLESASIYYAFLIKEILSAFSSLVWIKWPNDIYKEDQKIGGLMSARVNDNIVVGVGINLDGESCKYGVLGASNKQSQILENFLKILEKPPTWKQIFSKFRVEFQNNLSYSFHHNGKVVKFTEVKLATDGSLELNGEKIYSFR